MWQTDGNRKGKLAYNWIEEVCYFLWPYGCVCEVSGEDIEDELCNLFFSHFTIFLKLFSSCPSVETHIFYVCNHMKVNYSILSVTFWTTTLFHFYINYFIRLEGKYENHCWKTYLNSSRWTILSHMYVTTKHVALANSVSTANSFFSPHRAQQKKESILFHNHFIHHPGDSLVKPDSHSSDYDIYPGHQFLSQKKNSLLGLSGAQLSLHVWHQSMS